MVEWMGKGVSGMLTNEQRAHDLAIATLSIMSKKESVDVYLDYLELYKTLLSKLSADFPQETD